MPRLPAALALTMLFAGLTGPPAATADPGLDYLGQARLAQPATLDGTVIGGLSAISYDPGRDHYYLLSDDRSGHARFYTARITVSGSTVDVEMIGTRPLLDADGRPFAPRSAGRAAPDPEGIAYDPDRQRLYWSSEGERITDGPGGPVLADPWVRIAALDGSYLGEFALPANLAMSAQATGPRRNKTLEGLTLAPGGRLLFAAMEGPRYDDGDPPDRDHGALVRVVAFDVERRAATAQYAYPLDPAPPYAGPEETNGLTDLVALSQTQFLVVERAFSAATLAHQRVRVYRAEIGSATDITGTDLAGAGLTPMSKTLLADLDEVPGPVDNIEGITLGPRLPGGRQAVLLVSDDNFAPGQITQVLALATHPEAYS